MWRATRVTVALLLGIPAAIWEALDWMGRAEVFLTSPDKLAHVQKFIMEHQSIAYQVAPWVVMIGSLAALATLLWPRMWLPVLELFQRHILLFGNRAMAAQDIPSDILAAFRSLDLPKLGEMLSLKSVGTSAQVFLAGGLRVIWCSDDLKWRMMDVHSDSYSVVQDHWAPDETWLFDAKTLVPMLGLSPHQKPIRGGLARLAIKEPDKWGARPKVMEWGHHYGSNQVFRLQCKDGVAIGPMRLSESASDKSVVFVFANAGEYEMRLVDVRPPVVAQYL